LTASAAQPAAAPPTPKKAENDLSGTWTFSASVENDGQIAAEAAPVCTFQQTGDRITGTCKGPNAAGPAKGTVKGDKVVWKWVANPYTAGGSSMTLSLDGVLGADGVVRGAATSPVLNGLVGRFTQQRQ
jgi:hypothetical protein